MKHRRTQRNRTSKSPADRALLSRSARSQVEHYGKKKSTVPSFDRTSSTPCRRSRQLTEPYGTISRALFRSRAANNLPLSRSQIEHNGTKHGTVSSFVRTSLPPCRRSRQLHEHFFTVSVQSVRSRAANHSPWSRSQVELNGKKKRTVSSLVMTSSTPCRRRRQLIEPVFTESLQLFRSRAAKNLPWCRSQVEHNGTKKCTVTSLVMPSSTKCQRSRQLLEVPRADGAGS